MYSEKLENMKCSQAWVNLNTRKILNFIIFGWKQISTNNWMYYSQHVCLAFRIVHVLDLV